MLGRTGLLLCAVGCLTVSGVALGQEEACTKVTANCDSCRSNGFCKHHGHGDDCYDPDACLPIGARQVCKHGKLWPPYPRPTENAGCMARFHAAHYWPYPYDCQDRAAIRSTVAMHVNRGWDEAITFFDYHFDPETQELSQAGVAHLQWLMTDAPMQHRRALVQTSALEGANDTRVASVQEIASRLSGGQGSLPVELRNTTLSGRPAREVDAIRRKDLESIPDPRIQYGTGSSGYGLTDGR